jgi:hypothetical protein
MSTDSLLDRNRFSLEKLSVSSEIGSFCCKIEEYNQFLKTDSISYEDLHISNTWLLIEKTTKSIVAYMSVISDAIQLSDSEKSECGIELIPFCTIPATKLAKLAVGTHFREKNKGIGSLMIDLAVSLALCCNEYQSSRFLTVDADIEHDPGLIDFYRKNHFTLNEKMNTRKTPKTISMRRDLYGEYL